MDKWESWMSWITPSKEGEGDIVWLYAYIWCHRLMAWCRGRCSALCSAPKDSHPTSCLCLHWVFRPLEKPLGHPWADHPTCSAFCSTPIWFGPSNLQSNWDAAGSCPYWVVWDISSWALHDERLLNGKFSLLLLLYSCCWRLRHFITNYYFCFTVR